MVWVGTREQVLFGRDPSEFYLSGGWGWERILAEVEVGEVKLSTGRRKHGHPRLICLYFWPLGSL